jgi:hypothetical protein
MQTEEMIALTAFCSGHDIEPSFIMTLHDSGLVEIVRVEEQYYIHAEQLEQLEKMVRLYYDMDINVEGIETITYLLERMHVMQSEIVELKNRLGLFSRE